jgi:tetratricopeptide (TPR) repeat protein
LFAVGNMTRAKGQNQNTLPTTAYQELMAAGAKSSKRGGKSGKGFSTAGTADALRSWMRDDSPMISNLALQVGFELWKMNNKNFPECGGFLAKTGDLAHFNAAESVATAYSLADEMLSFRGECDIADVESLKLRSALSRIQWRLARMCSIRAYVARSGKNGALAEKEDDLADRLNETNPEYKKVILQDENDISANFALGMDHFMNHRYNKAEEHWKKALEKAPGEPAILNNLAVVLVRMDRYDEAESYAVKALEIMPKSKEIQETVRRIRELKQNEK